MEKTVHSEWIVPDSLSVNQLTIEAGGSIRAPEGKFVTLTVDGVGLEPVPGVYEGDVKLTVRDDFVRSSRRARSSCG